MDRTIWMFPRNKRRVRPLDYALILRALVVASSLGKEWVGDQDNQNKFASLLNDLNLKDGGDLQDVNSGGSRTYESQLVFLGLIFKDADGKIHLTQAGEDLVGLVDPASTLEHQILKVQYPSAYSMARGVGISSSIRIRPFNFILKLASDPDINGLSDQDIIIPVIFGHNDGCFDTCKEKILLSRVSGISSVVPDDDSLIRTSKTVARMRKGQVIPKTPYADRIADIKNIANTFKNVLQGVGVIDLREVDEQVRLFPRPEILPKLEEANSRPYIDFVHLPPNQAARQYGLTRGSKKDTRRSFMPSSNPELFTKNEHILKLFLDRVYLPVDQSVVNLFADEVSHDFKIPKELVYAALEPVLSNPDQYIGSNLIMLSKGGLKYAEAFERNVKNIFELEFGYNAQWTGRLKRDGVGGYMDVFVVEIGRNLCGIIDTKSTHRYDLPHDDYTKALQTYIPFARELYGKSDLNLKFVAYISHLISNGAGNPAQKMYEESNVPVSLISAYGLNNLRSDSRYKKNPAAVTDHLSKNSVNWVV